MSLRIGVLLHPGQNWSDLVRTAQEAEAAGWDGLWIGDHFVPTVGPDDGPMNELWSYLAGLAVATARIRLGSLVCSVTYRHPAVLLKQAVTVENISGGRLTLGLGAGWHQGEHEAYGIEYPSGIGRLELLEEACEVITRLLRSDRATFEGAHYRLRDAPLCPRPTQRSLPVLIGGGGEQRTMRLAARYADQWNYWGTPEGWSAKNLILDRRCEEEGRDPAEIERSCQALLFMSENTRKLREWRRQTMPRPPLIGTSTEVSDALGRYAEAGVSEFIVPDFTLPPAGPARWEAMATFAAAAVPHR